MEQLKKSRGRKLYGAVAVFLAVNLAAVIIIGVREAAVINRRMQQRAEDTAAQFESVMENYRHSFRLFVEMMRNEIKSSPDPDSIWDFLKGIDSTMLEIEGDTFDGLYMYYQGRYLYSWIRRIPSMRRQDMWLRSGRGTRTRRQAQVKSYLRRRI